MDSLFGIIAIIVIVVLSLKSDKKKKQAARQTPPAGNRTSVPKMSAQDAAQVFMNALTNAPDDEEEEEEPDLVEPKVDIESDLVEPKVDIACDLAEADRRTGSGEAFRHSGRKRAGCGRLHRRFARRA